MNLELLDVLKTKYGVTGLRHLGDGGFGVVYSGNVFEVPRAIKISRDVLDEKLLAMAEQELEFMKRPAIKACPTIVQLTAVWRELGHLVTVWDLGEQSLAARLADCQRRHQSGIPSEELERHLRDAAAGLDVINGTGVRHRDIKPDNIILMDGRAKITDLGLAVFVGASSLSKTASGTMGYIAPEAYGDEVQGHGRLTSTVDIYALAATAIKLATGRDPFGTNEREIIKNQDAGQPDTTGLTKDQVVAVLSALHPDPKQRGFATAMAFMEAFFVSRVGASSIQTIAPTPTALENEPFFAATNEVALTSTLPPVLVKRGSIKHGPMSSLLLVLFVAMIIGLGMGMVLPMFNPVPIETSHTLSMTSTQNNPVVPSTSEQPKSHLPVTNAVDDDRTSTSLASVESPSESSVEAVLDELYNTINKITGRDVRPFSLDWWDGAVAPRKNPRGDPPQLLVAPFTFEEAENARRKWAEHLNVPETFVGFGGIEFILIPPGEFKMGSPTDELQRRMNERLERVRIHTPIYMSAYEVTQREYMIVLGDDSTGWISELRANGHYGVKRVARPVQPSERKGAGMPVTNVSWHEALHFCEALSVRGRGSFRLPTEDEWEYACRAGTVTPCWFGDQLNGTDANCDGIYPYGTPMKGPFAKRPMPVGSYSANIFGLFDTHGNVWEWCKDQYRQDYHEQIPAVDSAAPNPNLERNVLRGGSWSDTSAMCRSAFRGFTEPGSRGDTFGFRLVMELLD